MNSGNEVKIWGGIECTINRVGNQYFDQSEYSGHYSRGTMDIDLVGSLGIKMLRYPVLWEKHAPVQDCIIDWSFVEKNLDRMRELDITPIAGLVHHGSGPDYVRFFNGSFEEGLADYAKKVATQFPWLEYYTPVNEPLTTARFCGLYGHWYPHEKTDYGFYKILLSECKATVMAMKAIREVNPEAKLIQTEDLGKCYSTPLLAYQAEMENHRRWLSYDLLCGKVNRDHYMWSWLMKAGIDENEVLYFIENNCVPHIAGFNYYITSERYLDEDMSKYPDQYHGGNYQHRYADIETVLVPMKEENGPALLLKEAWQHLGLPLAITECHLHSTREDQMRWFHTMWQTVNEVKDEGVDIRAITAWALFGLYGWNCLVTKPCGDYEPGVFNLSSGCPRPTALARVLQELTEHKVYYHPVLENEGWWQRSTRKQYGFTKQYQNAKVVRLNKKSACKPLLVLGKTGTLGADFGRICDERNIHHLLLSRKDLDITDAASIEQVIDELKPWGVVNAAGYVKVDEAEVNEKICCGVNAEGPATVARVCYNNDVRFLSFSSDLVFDGSKGDAYVESDRTRPLNAYGRSKAIAEEAILNNNPHALVIRTSSFFGPWDQYNFVATTLRSLKEGKRIVVPDDVFISPTYTPDLVNACLNFLLDGEEGIIHVANKGEISWADLAKQVALMTDHDEDLVHGVPLDKLRLRAKRPYYSVLQSEKGVVLPSLQDALERCLEAAGVEYQSAKIAV